MIDNLSKNLWLLLTIVLPGFFTYGLWRLSLYYIDIRPFTDDILKQIDESTLTTTCIIFALALMQQSFAIAIEFFLYILAEKGDKQQISEFKILICDRFILSVNDKINEKAERIVANFFLSLNMSVGVSLVIAYHLVPEKYKTSDILIISGLIVLLLATIAATFYRMKTAKAAIKECFVNAKTEKKDKKNKKLKSE